MVDHEAVRIVSPVIDQAAKARRAAADNNYSPLVIGPGPLMSPLRQGQESIRSQK
jgi:hypothetical protein